MARPSVSTVTVICASVTRTRSRTSWKRSIESSLPLNTGRSSEARLDKRPVSEWNYAMKMQRILLVVTLAAVCSLALAQSASKTLATVEGQAITEQQVLQTAA